ncbi:MAG TPA: SpoIIE family protein phosphatase, partial [Gemmataceae bacterium]|nr:SpoIIE family protein phosphatase [Gemmataceae bacterium]
YFSAPGVRQLDNRGLNLFGRRRAGSEFPIDLGLSPLPFGGDTLAVAMIRDITERKRAERRLAAEHAVAGILAVSDTLRDAAPKIIRAVCESSEWDVGIFWIMDRDMQVLRCLEFWHTPTVDVSAFEEACRQSTLTMGAGLAGHVWGAQTMIWVPDLSAHAGFPRGRVAATDGLRGAIAFPIGDGTEIHAVLEFFSREVREPNVIYREMIDSIVSHVSQFIGRRDAETELHTQEADRRVAQHIQQGLLPKAVPTFPGFQISGKSVSAHDVGGDCFDFIPMVVNDQECLGVLVADASGHGIAAALLVAHTRAYLRALALACTDVGTLLTLSNQRLVSDLVTDHFVTLFLMRLDPRAYSVQYASAGHWPGYVLDREGRTRAILASTGGLLGIDPKATFPKGPTITLAPGELVLLFTDGVVEAATPDGKPFGLERTLGVVRAHRHEPPQAILEALFTAATHFAEHHIVDDRTAVIIKIEGPA